MAVLMLPRQLLGKAGQVNVLPRVQVAPRDMYKHLRLVGEYKAFSTHADKEYRDG